MKSKRYLNLHKLDKSPNWIFRKYSSERKREFVKSTGFLATEANAPAAYKKGIELFDDWLGSSLPSVRGILIRDIGKAILRAKEGKRSNTYRSFKNQFENHVNPAFGHLRPEQMTSIRWIHYDAEERKKGKRTKLFNTRKTLNEILNRAKEEGVLRQVPKLRNLDGPASPPRYLPKVEYLRIRRSLSWNVKLLAFVMYQQGPRPTEALHYRLSMIDWNLGHEQIRIPGEITKTGRTRCIPLNPKVARVFRWMKENSLEGDCLFPSREDANQPLSAYNAVWDRTMKQLKLDYTIYNVRDTFITNKLKEGLSSTFIGKYTDTSATMIEKKYAVAEEEVMKKVAG